MTQTIHEKSKKRVKELGEVFTPPQTVNQMIDLLDQEAFRDSKFFEPTCGNGNILIVSTERRLNLLYEKNKKDEEFNKMIQSSSFPLSSLLNYTVIEICMHTYAADIMLDNVLESRQKMKELVSKWYEEKAKELELKESDIQERSFILDQCFRFIDQNIQHADCLAGLSKTYEEAKKSASLTKASQAFFEEHGWLKIHFD